MKRLSLGMLLIFVLSLLLSSCQASPAQADFVLHAGTGSRAYLGEDCNSGLLAQFKLETGYCIQVVYKGTVELSQEMDIVVSGQNKLVADAFLPEDGVWVNPNFKTQTKIAEGYVLVGIDQHTAAAIGWDNHSSHTLKELIDLVSNDTLKLVVCNANQCNSGALFYMAIINALKGSTGTLVVDDLTNELTLAWGKQFYSHVSRSAGSTSDAANVYYQDKKNGTNAYNALVTYEVTGAQTNQKLAAEGLTPLSFFYLEDASILSSPTLVFNYESPKKDIYDLFSAFMQRVDTQPFNVLQAIADSGWRPATFGFAPSPQVLKTEWGFEAFPSVNPVSVPRREVAQTAIDIFISHYKMPSDVVFVFDNSGSMYTNQGIEGLRDAVTKLADLSWRSFNQIDPGPYDTLTVFTFGTEVNPDYITVSGNDPSQLAQFSENVIKSFDNRGNTALYSAGVTALDYALKIRREGRNVSIVLMTDGKANTGIDRAQFIEYYQQHGQNIPVYSIAFGADAKQELGYEVFGIIVNGQYYDGDDLATALYKILGN